MKARWWLMGGVVSVALLAVLEWRDASPTPALRHVVIVSFDTLRADHLGAYGGPIGLTPALDGFAAEAVVVNTAVAAAPTTLSSHVSLFTGQWPHHHGVPRNGFVIDPKNEMLAERLQGEGFLVGGIVGATPLSSKTGIDQGFDFYDDVDASGHAERDGARVTDAALTWLDAVGASPDGPPVVLFVHYFDAHAPYGAPDGQVDDPDAIARVVGDAVLGGFDHIRSVRGMLLRGEPEAAAHSAALATLYRAGVRHVDAEFGRLVKGLRRRGILDTAVVLVTADHGETMLRPEEWWNHGHTLFDDTVHVPLMVRFPGMVHGGARMSRVVSLIDVAPTIGELLGQVWDGMDGVSFAPSLEGREQEPRGPVFSEATKPWRSVGTDGWANDSLPKAARRGDRKLLLWPESGEVRSFDLRTDRGETAPRDRWPGLHADLRAWAADPKPLPSVMIEDPDMTRQLRVLGYVD